MSNWPKIKSRRTIDVSPWMKVIEREVEFAAGDQPELYHAVAQQDYIAIVAVTPGGKIPIVRQYRPALERFTWELPAGLVDKDETAADCCRRELMEETGFPAKTVHALGSYAPCTARLSNHIHSFFVETGPRTAAPKTEAGIELKLVTPHELAALILPGEFDLQLHIGVILLAGMRGHLDLGAFQAPKTI
ncbi:MAG: NUDIX hydrolase [Pseudolabrys sp.]|nr:NUDIX hydrolase [Pseudolabrys sp.]MSP32631.1 NUDIX hydrolase [Pseudolabrys sp.]